MGNAHDPKVGDVLPQSFMPQAFPVGHIHPVGGGQFIEGGGQRSAAILRAAEGQVNVGAGPLPAQCPGAIEPQPADLGALLPLLREDHFPASWPLLQICGKGSQRRSESFPDQGQSLLSARHVIEMGHQVALLQHACAHLSILPALRSVLQDALRVRGSWVPSA
jgi:hypothetical protein